MTDNNDAKCYSVTDWDKRFENSQSRKYNKLSWVPMPNKHDSGGYKRIAIQDDACDIFTAWILMVQVASRMPRRGILADDTEPLDADELALRTSYPQRIFERAFEVLVHPKINWLQESTVGALVGEWESATQKERKKERNLTDSEAEECKKLTSYFMEEIAQGYGRNLVTTPQSTYKGIAALISKGIKPKDIRSAVKWLATENQRREYRFDVLSGKALADKWDRICAAMGRPKRRKGPNL